VVRKFESLASESETLHAYLREISSFPLLTPDDEQQLGRQIQQHGDEDALGRLVQSNLRFVVQYAKRFRRLGVPLLDLIHEGNLGLIEAARRFDPAQSDTVQASALWWIRQAMMPLLAEAGRNRGTGGRPRARTRRGTCGTKPAGGAGGARPATAATLRVGRSSSRLARCMRSVSTACCAATSTKSQKLEVRS